MKLQLGQIRGLAGQELCVDQAQQLFLFGVQGPNPRRCAPQWRAQSRRFGEFRSENRSTGCQWGLRRLTVEVDWPDQERLPEVFHSPLICSQSESYKIARAAPELIHRPLKKVTYLFGEPLTRQGLRPISVNLFVDFLSAMAFKSVRANQ